MCGCLRKITSFRIRPLKLNVVAVAFRVKSLLSEQVRCSRLTQCCATPTVSLGAVVFPSSVSRGSRGSSIRKWHSFKAGRNRCAFVWIESAIIIYQSFYDQYSLKSEYSCRTICAKWLNCCGYSEWVAEGGDECSCSAREYNSISLLIQGDFIVDRTKFYDRSFYRLHMCSTTFILIADQSSFCKTWD